MTKTNIRQACQRGIESLLPVPAQYTWEFRREGASSSTYWLRRYPTAAAIHPGIWEIRVCVHPRNRVRPSDIPLLAAKYEDTCDHRVLFTEYVTAGVAERLRAEGKIRRELLLAYRTGLTRASGSTVDNSP